MSELYTTISLTGEVATLLNRDAMLRVGAPVGHRVIDVGDAYMDRGNNTVPIFNDLYHPPSTPVRVGDDVVHVERIETQNPSYVFIYEPLTSAHPAGAPVFRLDYFDVSTAFPTLTAPCTIRIGME